MESVILCVLFGFFHSICSLSMSVLLHVLEAGSFQLLYSVPFYGPITISFSILWLMDIRIVSNLVLSSMRNFEK